MVPLRDWPIDNHEGCGFRADLEEFIADHRPHGILTGDATEPAWNGDLSPWRVRVAWCSSGG